MDLHYRKYGDGQPLLILHGLLGSSGNWHSMSRDRFSRHWTAYTLDLRNHGASPHAAEMSYALMAKDVVSFVRSLRAGNVHVLGHSMGGKVAMQLAISYPHVVDRLIVVDVAPRALDDAQPGIIQALSSIDLSRHTNRRAIDRELSEHFSSAPVRQLLLKNLRRREGRYMWRPNLEALERAYPQIAGPVTARGIFEGDTLFIRGGRSDYVRDDDLRGIHERFPAAQLVTIEGAGHWVHADAPEAFADTVEEFLTSTVTTR